MADESLSGLTPNEAKEFHRYYMQGLVLFVAIAIFAHFLVWVWRPWFHPEQVSSVSDVLPSATTTLMSLLG